MGEIIIRYINLPCSVRGFVKEDCDGNYNIYINTNLSYKMQCDVLSHELSHIEEKHLDSHEDIDAIEREAWHGAKAAQKEGARERGRYCV
jgi:hypothetical protein